MTSRQRDDGAFLPTPFLQSLALTLLLHLMPMKVRQSKVCVMVVLVWMFFLHWAVLHAASAEIPRGPRVLRADLARIKQWAELKPITVGDFLQRPEIKIEPRFLTKEQIPEEVKKDENYQYLEEVFDLADKEEFERAYILSDKWGKRYEKTEIGEWILLVKGDLLYQVQADKEKPRWSVVLEDYQECLRKFPLTKDKARALYQIALVQLHLGFFADVDSTAERGLKEFGLTELGPLFQFLRGEQAFRNGNLTQTAAQLTILIKDYPKSQAAVDAAYRLALARFARGDYEGALKFYQTLDRYHANEVDILKMKVDPSSEARILDRAFFGETLFLNGIYAESSKIFQDLANLFPKHPQAAIFLLRFADTFYVRGQFRGAEQLYRSVGQLHPQDMAAQALWRIKTADLLYVTHDVRAHKENEKLYSEAIDIALKAKMQEVAAFAKARLASHYLAFSNYPKAQRTLRAYVEDYRSSRNYDWAKDQLTKTIEAEIKDYYLREDYLAALATYLGTSDEQRRDFRDTRILLSLADATRKLQLFDKTSEILNRVIYLEKTPEGRQEALLGLAEILIVQKDYRRAAERLRRFKFAYPTSPLRPTLEKLWGDIYVGLKNNERAIQYYEEALIAAEKEPAYLFDLRFIHLSLANLYDQQQLTLQSVAAYKEYLKVIREVRENPTTSLHLTKRDEFNESYARYRVADLLFGMRDFVRALEAYKSVVAEVKQEPFLSHAQYKIGECFILLGDQQSALEAFGQFKTEDPNNVWAKAAQSYMKTVEMEVKYGVKILN